MAHARVQVSGLSERVIKNFFMNETTRRVPPLYDPHSQRFTHLYIQYLSLSLSLPLLMLFLPSLSRCLHTTRERVNIYICCVLRANRRRTRENYIIRRCSLRPRGFSFPQPLTLCALLSIMTYQLLPPLILLLVLVCGVR